jgi:hypothetical protein
MHIIRVTAFMILLLCTCVAGVAAQASPIASVPMEYRGPIPTIKVMINGKGPFVFSVDTGGGPQADIDTSIVTQLGLPSNGKVRGGDPSGQNSREFDTVRVDSIAVGGIEFRNVTALSREQRIIPNYPKVDGILGFSLFSEYLLTLDYPAQQLRLARGELPAVNGADILSFESPHRIPVIDLAVGSFKVKAHIDSGNMVGGFILPASLVEKLTLAAPAITVGHARTVTNDIEIKQAQLNETIKLGSTEFPQPTISFPALSDLNIGFKILKEFRMTFDQKNKRVKFERQSPKPVQPAVISAAWARDYVGSYGDRTISFEGDVLYLQRQDGPRIKLVAGAPDEFTLQPVPAARIKFVRDESGKVTELRVLNREGQWEAAGKVQP